MQASMLTEIFRVLDKQVRSHNNKYNAYVYVCVGRGEIWCGLCGCVSLCVLVCVWVCVVVYVGVCGRGFVYGSVCGSVWEFVYGRVC